MELSSSVLRLAWAAVEETSPRDLLTLSDRMLVKCLLQRVDRNILLSGEEVGALSNYLDSKVSLIRDLAESRLRLTPQTARSISAC